MKRSSLILGLLLLLLALPATASAKVPKEFFGTTAVSPTDKDYGRMGKAGFGTGRFELSWRVIQKTRKSGYDWGYVDARMIQSAKAGIEPSLVVFGTPRFVRKSQDGLFPPTDSAENLEEWADFVHAAVKRYGPNGIFWQAYPDLPKKPVHQWIVWNEQNARNFWRSKPNPKDYAKLVKVSSKAISEVDPNAEIVLGGMYCCPNDERSYTATDFLRAVYKVNGIERHFDTINVHPYGSGVATVKKQIRQLRSVAVKAGDKNVGTLVGELGWASAGPSRSEEVVGVKGQTKRMRDGLELLVKKQRSWNITGVNIYVWRDFSPDLTSCLWCPYAGLYEEDGTAKPALKAVRDVIKAST